MTSIATPHARVLALSARHRFLADMRRVLGNDRVIWTPDPLDGLKVADDSAYRRTFTHSTAPLPRMSRLGDGYGMSFVPGSGHYLDTPDAANLSFGTGAADSAMSVVAVANVTNTANGRTIVSKWDTSNLEWLFNVSTTDVLTFRMQDQSAGVAALRASDAAITQGSWRVFGASYDGSGGATAANGVTLYQDGAVIASTATNNAAYVAMENLAAPVEIGSQTAHTTQLWEGSLALVAVCQKQLTTANHAAIVTLCRRYFGVP